MSDDLSRELDHLAELDRREEDDDVRRVFESGALAWVHAALRSGDLTPEDLGMVRHGAVYETRTSCYRIPSAPEPGSSDTSREAPAPSLACAPSPGTSDGPRPVAEAP